LKIRHNKTYNDYIGNAARRAISAKKRNCRLGKAIGIVQSVLRRAIADRALVARSQPYYLDVTPAGTDKGIVVDELAARLAIPVAEIATIGDMENDVAMFLRNGFSIAMGNASPEVKRLADASTLANDEDGFATAVERLILPRAQGDAASF